MFTRLLLLSILSQLFSVAYSQEDPYQAASLTASQAAKIASKTQSFKSFLTLPNLKELTPEVAKELAKAKGELSLPALTSLSTESAAEFAHHEGSLILANLASLSAETAAALAPQKGLLSLRVNNPSPETLQGLARHTGVMVLEGFTTLSDEQAAALSNCQCRLNLKNVTTLSATQASALAKIPFDLDLPELVQLDLDAQNNFALHTKPLTVANLTQLNSLNFATKLAATSHRIDLHYVTTMSNECLQALVKSPEQLVLGLTSISPEQAAILVEHQGSLVLDRVSELPPAAIELLIKRTGKLSLGALTTLNDARLARAIAASKPSFIRLNQLKQLDDEVARELISAKCSLLLNGLTNLSDETAAVLGEHQGNLSLQQVSNISEKAAHSLAKHSRMLRLGKTEQFSQVSLDILQQNPEVHFVDLSR